MSRHFYEKILPILRSFSRQPSPKHYSFQWCLHSCDMIRVLLGGSGGFLTCQEWDWHQHRRNIHESRSHRQVVIWVLFGMTKYEIRNKHETLSVFFQSSLYCIIDHEETLPELEPVSFHQAISIYYESFLKRFLLHISFDRTHIRSRQIIVCCNITKNFLIQYCTVVHLSWVFSLAWWILKL